MKAPKTTEKTTEQVTPKATDVLTTICEQAIAYRFPSNPPTLAALARLVGVASRVISIRDLDERISVENAVVIGLAKKRGLVS